MAERRGNPRAPGPLGSGLVNRATAVDVGASPAGGGCGCRQEIVTGSGATAEAAPAGASVLYVPPLPGEAPCGIGGAADGGSGGGKAGGGGRGGQPPLLLARCTAVLGLVVASAARVLTTAVRAALVAVPRRENTYPGRAAATAAATDESIARVCWQRLGVLVSLLLLQSLSQFVLEHYEDLISANLVIPLFLTMLVGAGGNAGNQAAVRAITGLVTGEFRPSHMWRVLRKELAVGAICSTVLACIAYLRVYYYYTNEENQPSPVGVTVAAISLSLFLIVFVSVLVGSALPFGLRRCGLNVEHAAPMIQVLMDIMGVFISCVVCSAMLPRPPPALR